MGRKKKEGVPNISVTLYKGEFELYLECCGEDRCQFATFHANPPEPDDECSRRQGCNCGYWRGRLAAMKGMSAKLTAEIDVMEKDLKEAMEHE